MKNIIIGTAGHIDHGKTTLIKALTGIDTDRLIEEKKRGISIDLGFTDFNINKNKVAGIIDVPGHEKFLKNMLAGVAGMDMILLVISAEEGVMPQTKEHLDILNLIGIKKGLIVLSKADKVDDDFAELVIDDIKKVVSGTFLENAEIIKIDSISNRGIDLLKRSIDTLTENLESKNLNLPSRLFVDRVFSIKGFGTVVTGTLVEGTLKVDDLVYIYPQKKESRIRGIQVHSTKKDKAFAGQRVAINLSNITVEDLKRGDIISSNSNLPISMMIDAKVTILEGASKDLEHWDRIRLYHGAREILARVVPLQKEKIPKGETGYVQIRLEEEISCIEKDNIILRLYSPIETIGGGVVVDSHASKHTSNTLGITDILKKKEEGSLADKICALLEKTKQLVSIEYIKSLINEIDINIEKEIDYLIDSNKIKVINNLIIDDKILLRIISEIDDILISYHIKFPYRKGISKEELRSKLTFNLKPKEFDIILNKLNDDGKIIAYETQVSKNDFQITFNGESKKIKDEIEAYYFDNKTPMLTDKFVGNCQMKLEILNYFIGDRLIKISEEIIYDKNLLNCYENFVKNHLLNNDSISIQDLKEETGLSRKYLIAIMEYFDKIKVTKRYGDSRVAF